MNVEAKGQGVQGRPGGQGGSEGQPTGEKSCTAQLIEKFAARLKSFKDKENWIITLEECLASCKLPLKVKNIFHTSSIFSL